MPALNLSDIPRLAQAEPLHSLEIQISEAISQISSPVEIHDQVLIPLISWIETAFTAADYARIKSEAEQQISQASPDLNNLENEINKVLCWFSAARLQEILINKEETKTPAEIAAEVMQMAEERKAQLATTEKSKSDKLVQRGLPYRVVTPQEKPAPPPPAPLIDIPKTVENIERSLHYDSTLSTEQITKKLPEIRIELEHITDIKQVQQLLNRIEKDALNMKPGTLSGKAIFIGTAIDTSSSIPASLFKSHLADKKTQLGFDESVVSEIQSVIDRSDIADKPAAVARILNQHHLPADQIVHDLFSPQSRIGINPLPPSVPQANQIPFTSLYSHDVSDHLVKSFTQHKGDITAVTKSFIDQFGLPAEKTSEFSQILSPILAGLPSQPDKHLDQSRIIIESGLKDLSPEVKTQYFSSPQNIKLTSAQSVDLFQQISSIGNSAEAAAKITSFFQHEYPLTRQQAQAAAEVTLTAFQKPTRQISEITIPVIPPRIETITHYPSLPQQIPLSDISSHVASDFLVQEFQNHQGDIEKVASSFIKRYGLPAENKTEVTQILSSILVNLPSKPAENLDQSHSVIENGLKNHISPPTSIHQLTLDSINTVAHELHLKIPDTEQLTSAVSTHDLDTVIKIISAAQRGTTAPAISASQFVTAVNNHLDAALLTQTIASAAAKSHLSTDEIQEITRTFSSFAKDSSNLTVENVKSFAAAHHIDLDDQTLSQIKFASPISTAPVPHVQLTQQQVLQANQIIRTSSSPELILPALTAFFTDTVHTPASQAAQVAQNYHSSYEHTLLERPAVGTVLSQIATLSNIAIPAAVIQKAEALSGRPELLREFLLSDEFSTQSQLTQTEILSTLPAVIASVAPAVASVSKLAVNEGLSPSEITEFKTQLATELIQRPQLSEATIKEVQKVAEKFNVHLDTPQVVAAIAATPEIPLSPLKDIESAEIARIISHSSDPSTDIQTYLQQSGFTASQSLHLARQYTSLAQKFTDAGEALPPESLAKTFSALPTSSQNISPSLIQATAVVSAATALLTDSGIPAAQSQQLLLEIASLAASPIELTRHLSSPAFISSVQQIAGRPLSLDQQNTLKIAPVLIPQVASAAVSVAQSALDSGSSPDQLPQLVSSVSTRLITSSLDPSHRSALAAFIPSLPPYLTSTQSDHLAYIVTHSKDVVADAHNYVRQEFPDLTPLQTSSLAAPFVAFKPNGLSQATISTAFSAMPLAAPPANSFLQSTANIAAITAVFTEVGLAGPASQPLISKVARFTPIEFQRYLSSEELIHDLGEVPPEKINQVKDLLPQISRAASFTPALASLALSRQLDPSLAAEFSTAVSAHLSANKTFTTSGLTQVARDFHIDLEPSQISATVSSATQSTVAFAAISTYLSQSGISPSSPLLQGLSTHTSSVSELTHHLSTSFLSDLHQTTPEKFTRISLALPTLVTVSQIAANQGFSTSQITALTQAIAADLPQHPQFSPSRFQEIASELHLQLDSPALAVAAAALDQAVPLPLTSTQSLELARIISRSPDHLQAIPQIQQYLGVSAPIAAHYAVYAQQLTDRGETISTTSLAQRFHDLPVITPSLPLISSQIAVATALFTDAKIPAQSVQSDLVQLASLPPAQFAIYLASPEFSSRLHHLSPLPESQLPVLISQAAFASSAVSEIVNLSLTRGLDPAQITHYSNALASRLSFSDAKPAEIVQLAKEFGVSLSSPQVSTALSSVHQTTPTLTALASFIQETQFNPPVSQALYRQLSTYSAQPDALREFVSTGFLAEIQSLAPNKYTQAAHLLPQYLAATQLAASQNLPFFSYPEFSHLVYTELQQPDFSVSRLNQAVTRFNVSFDTPHLIAAAATYSSPSSPTLAQSTAAVAAITSLLTEIGISPSSAVPLLTQATSLSSNTLELQTFLSSEKFVSALRDLAPDQRLNPSQISLVQTAIPRIVNTVTTANILTQYAVSQGLPDYKISDFNTAISSRLAFDSLFQPSSLQQISRDFQIQLDPQEINRVLVNYYYQPDLLQNSTQFAATSALLDRLGIADKQHLLTRASRLTPDQFQEYLTSPGFLSDLGPLSSDQLATLHSLTPQVSQNLRYIPLLSSAALSSGLSPDQLPDFLGQLSLSPHPLQIASNYHIHYSPEQLSSFSTTPVLISLTQTLLTDAHIPLKSASAQKILTTVASLANDPSQLHAYLSSGILADVPKDLNLVDRTTISFAPDIATRTPLIQNLTTLALTEGKLPLSQLADFSSALAAHYSPSHNLTVAEVRELATSFHISLSSVNIAASLAKTSESSIYNQIEQAVYRASAGLTLSDHQLQQVADVFTSSAQPLEIQSRITQIVGSPQIARQIITFVHQDFGLPTVSPETLSPEAIRQAISSGLKFPQTVEFAMLTAGFTPDRQQVNDVAAHIKQYSGDVTGLANELYRMFPSIKNHSEAIVAAQNILLFTDIRLNLTQKDLAGDINSSLQYLVSTSEFSAYTAPQLLSAIRTSTPEQAILNLQKIGLSSDQIQRVVGAIQITQLSSLSPASVPLEKGFEFTVSRILTAASIPDSEHSRIITELYQIKGTVPASEVQELLIRLLPNASKELSSALVIYTQLDPASQAVIDTFYQEIAGVINARRLDLTPEQLAQSAQIIADIKKQLPTNSLEAKKIELIGYVYPTIQHSPEIVIPALFKATTGQRFFDPTSANVINEQVLQLIFPLLSNHPQLLALYESNIQKLSISTGFDPNVVKPFALRIALVQMQHPEMDLEKLIRYYHPRMESAAGRPTLSTFNIRLLASELKVISPVAPLSSKETAARKQIVALLDNLGISKTSSQLIAENLKIPYYLSSFASSDFKNLTLARQQQSALFQQLLPKYLDQLNIDSRTQNTILANVKNLFDTLQRAHGSPTSINPALQNRIILSEYVHLLSQDPKFRWVTDRFLNTPFGLRYFPNRSGRISAAIPFNARLAQNRYTIKGNQILNKIPLPLKNRLVKSAAGKAISQAASKIAVKLGLQAVGSAIPGIGNVVAFITGWVVDKLQQLATAVVMAVSSFIHDNVEPVGIAILNALSGTGLFTTPLGSGGLARGVIGSLQSGIARAGSVLAELTSTTVTSSVTALTAIVLTIPIVVALILYIINAGAYVVPMMAGSRGDLGCWPVDVGYLSNGPPHGGNNNLDAFDIAGNDGAPVYASITGTVIFAGLDPQTAREGSGPSGGGYGNYVKIDSGLGYCTIYGHMSTVLVSTGQQVNVGTQLGFVDHTGYSTGPHLHYEWQVGCTFQAGGTEIINHVPPGWEIGQQLNYAGSCFASGKNAIP